MHRIDTPGSVNGQFASGNPFAVGGGIPATIMGPLWPNAVQEEIAGVIEGESITLSKGTNTQLAEALLAQYDRLLGRLFTFTATEDLSQGEGFLFRDVFGVLLADVLNTFTGTLIVRGRHSLAKASADNITKGDRVLWDQSTREVTTQTGGGEVDIGYADSSAGAGPGSVNVVLTGPPNL